MNNNQLELLRHQIVQIDRELVNLLISRFEVVKVVGQFKHEQNLPPLDKNRWQIVLQSRIKWGKGIEQVIKDVFETIHRHALITEEKEL